MNMPLYEIYFKTGACISMFFIRVVFYQLNYLKFVFAN